MSQPTSPQSPPSPARYLLDTNVLLRRADSKSPMHSDATQSVSLLLASGAFICITAQNIIEFWNVATRPEANNGLGWDSATATKELANLKAHLTFLPDHPAIFDQWERLVSDYSVQGVQVHDTRLCAVALTYQIGHILTFNGKDFRRFAPEGLVAIDPTTVVAISRTKI